MDIDILSTGGTKNFIEGIGVNVTDVSSVTGFPEILDGRVKTLHPNIHGGLLGIKTNKDHMETLKSNSINTIDLLIVNLYPFEDTIKKDVSFEECIENIDIGGPAMIRAAAENHNSVAVVVDKDDYGLIIEELKKDGKVLEKTLKNLALKAYSRTAAYDSAISNWMNKQVKDGDQTYKSFGGKKIQSLRYGENPHQEAAFYTDGTNRSGVITAEQIQGKELSYNNINDTDAAFELVSEFDPNKSHAVAIIKHANPCGVSSEKNQLKSFKFEDLGEMLSLGIGNASITGYGITLAGPLAFEIRRLKYLKRMQACFLSLKGKGSWLFSKKIINRLFSQYP